MAGLPDEGKRSSIGKANRCGSAVEYLRVLSIGGWQISLD
ncbi:hypothetical protein SNOG_12688 [Parastagonospora nodorum SN15]|uniref:Uncharacterized protein n=1 Tax=Phaeosphaeria nodorum (strain SN15 / ATCC MYA-4574 / FGSC 10173) TaxID=321614 RepID=Q0U6C6_PHANO|nr:hypothetical protein SNOG_12688 [Parastagonospora nodorum SN15]EAT79986.1 hypothetical protein SNOG_12688 [Parastagonospora nodorum SN15]